VSGSLDRLAEQSNRYHAMMISTNAQQNATLQQIVQIMQPYVTILSLQEHASTQSLLINTLPDTGKAPTPLTL